MLNIVSKLTNISKSLFGHPWFAGVIIFVVGVAYAFCAKNNLPQSVGVSLIASLTTTTIGNILKAYKDEIIDALRDCQDNILNEQRSDLGNLASSLKEPYFRMLGQKIINQAGVSVDEIRAAEISPLFKNELNYTRYLREKVGSLNFGDEIYALCGGKDWSSPEVKEYFKDNIQAVARGCKIARIFVQTGTSFSHEQKKIIENHERAGATVLVISRERLAELFQAYQLPIDFGFVIFKKEVVVHRGLKANSREGVVLKDENLIALHRQIFDDIKHSSRPYVISRSIAA